MCRSGSIKQKLLDFIPKKSLVNQVCFWTNFFYGNKKCNIIESQEISFKFIFFFPQKVIFWNSKHRKIHHFKRMHVFKNPNNTGWVWTIPYGEMAQTHLKPSRLKPISKSPDTYKWQRGILSIPIWNEKNNCYTFSFRPIFKHVTFT